MFPRFIFLLGLLLWGASARAEVLVLVQGYLGRSDAWRESGVTEVLTRNGWADGGTLTVRAGVVRGDRPPGPEPRRFYTLILPSDSGLLRQAQFLNAYLSGLRAGYPGQSLILVGHSAGGVAARLAMVQHPEHKVGALITIASPHLGTESAEVGALLGQTPLAIFAPLIGGGALNSSQTLFRDLARERPGNLLFWLNRQEHPQALYVSVVRKDESLLGVSDIIVPAWSQDMNNVQALRGRARRVVTQGAHALSEEDGQILIRVLDTMGRT